MIDARSAQFIAIERREVQRAARVFALALVAALMACAAAAFAAIAILAALGEEHRAMGSAVIATGVALLVLVAVLLARHPGE